MTKAAFDKIAEGLNEALETVRSMTESDIPDDIREEADRVVRDLYGLTIYAGREAWEAVVAGALAAERERCARKIDEGFEKPVGTTFRADGKPSKNDECPHDRYMYEDCDACCAAAIRRPDALP